MKNLYFGMLLIQVSVLSINSILAMEVPACSDKSRLCKKLEASGRCTNPKVAKKCPKSCLNCCLPDTSPMCAKWKEEGLCSNETVLEQCIQTCTGCCPDNDFLCHMRDLKETVVKTCSKKSPGGGSLNLLDINSVPVCQITWTATPSFLTLQTFNVAQGFTSCHGNKTKTARQMKILSAGNGTKISVNGLPVEGADGVATSTTIFDVTSIISSSPVVIGNLDQNGIYPQNNSKVTATNFNVGGISGQIGGRVSTVTVLV